MIQINKIVVAFLIILFIANILIWQITSMPLGVGSMLIILLLIIVLTIRNRFTWVIALIVYVFGVTFNEKMLPYLRPIINVNVFRITKSLSHLGSNHNLIVASKLIPPILYLVLFFIFLTREYRVKYGISKEPKKRNFWNRIF